MPVASTPGAHIILSLAQSFGGESGKALQVFLLIASSTSSPPKALSRPSCSVCWNWFELADNVHLFPTLNSGYHTGSLKLAREEVFTPQKLANTPDQGFPP